MNWLAFGILHTYIDNNISKVPLWFLSHPINKIKIPINNGKNSVCSVSLFTFSTHIDFTSNNQFGKGQGWYFMFAIVEFHRVWFISITHILTIIIYKHRTFHVVMMHGEIWMYLFFWERVLFYAKCRPCALWNWSINSQTQRYKCFKSHKI